MLKSLPDAVSNLRRLKILYLAKNELTSVPSLRECRQLQDIRLHYNRLVLPPDGIDQLAEITNLDVNSENCFVLLIIIGLLVES